MLPDLRSWWPSRTRLRQWFHELHFTLRTEGDSPGRLAAAIAIGTFVGCTPLYGTHLAICVALASLFRLNRALTYLAAHINNPLTAPWLWALSFGIGHRLMEGVWPPWSVSQVFGAGLLAIGRDLLVGSLALGAVLGPILGGVAYVVARRRDPDPGWTALVHAVSHRYRESGPFHWEFVRAKLRRDPVYRDIHARLASWRGGTLLDLGCGRGIALTLLDTVRGGVDLEARPLDLVGVERSPRAARVARKALAGRGRVLVADLRDLTPPAADRVLLIDVLHYLDAPSQERLAAAVLDALRPGGVVLLREADAAAGFRFTLTRAGERLMAMLRGRGAQRFHYRSAAEWQALFARPRARIVARDASRGTPFANVLIEVSFPPAASRPLSESETEWEPPGAETSRNAAAPEA
ncbi:MAG TPA: DUF2062 domain-containing protein [Candidatus Polarisedimenticolia bacterium]|jgi:uncharacterized protein (DUF2062 family)/SAM-dependent methyltransferase|nr:DUF2062 domain-containing protein [Candidatus Polarisedimenticolia bacterium]